ncbi:MAG: SGNH/GDSL hydrolase family protein [Pirellulales bacterium]
MRHSRIIPAVGGDRRSSASTTVDRVSLAVVTVFVAAAIGGAAVAIADDPASTPARPVTPEPLRDGDRVVFLGDTFFEREGQRGFIESALAAAHPAAAIRFRNLGWSGDTVWAESRGVFDAPSQGYDRMLPLVGEIAPTVIFIAYGRNESERGDAGLEAFRGQLAKLCDDVRTAAAGKDRSPESVRLLLVTPSPCETIDADRRNATLAATSAVIREVAVAKSAGLVDLFGGLSQPAAPGTRRTDNGIHLSDAGYAEAATRFVEACGGRLPADFAARSADLRRLVVDKNTLFFHRWRPANETYLFLFRKHEQGNNVVEIPRFDPLVEEAEQKVHEAAGTSEKKR